MNSEIYQMLWMEGSPVVWSLWRKERAILGRPGLILNLLAQMEKLLCCGTPSTQVLALSGS